MFLLKNFLRHKKCIFKKENQKKNLLTKKKFIQLKKITEILFKKNTRQPWTQSHISFKAIKKNNKTPAF